MLTYLLMITGEKDKEKFELIYEKYRKLMFYVANQILNDPYMAEDAVHHTFIKIIENLDKIEDVHSHKTKSYIVTMVKNRAINLYNQRQRHTMIPLEEINYNLADDITSHEELDYLTKAIIQLPVIYQEVLKLKYVQEYSNTEIAQMLDISEVTIRKRLERTKRKLQEILEKEDHTDEL
ncbi:MULTISPECIES: RNA polymerase sigma factor [Dehalobacter]|uniref:RNA polymerase subunit sigma-24 n=2 Tax=Dehalobacter restrictus TaxID=55583 RepID=A0ABN4BRK4_DEHRP|nr:MULTISPECIES: RNA polymerase sigma factor [Dehalobacter]AHF09052.1 RNA polymerase subunit sigma-24 [Dehalobacter restrictus DSM 9455]